MRTLSNLIFNDLCIFSTFPVPPPPSRCARGGVVPMQKCIAIIGFQKLPARFIFHDQNIFSSKLDSNIFQHFERQNFIFHAELGICFFLPFIAIQKTQVIDFKISRAPRPPPGYPMVAPQVYNSQRWLSWFGFWCLNRFSGKKLCW